MHSVSQRCKQVIFCKSKSSSTESLIVSPKSSHKSMLGVTSQVTTYSRVKSNQVTTQCKSRQVTSIWLQVKSHTFTACHVLILQCTVLLLIHCDSIVISPGEFHHFVRFECIFKGLNWFYYILSKAFDLRCQQVIFSKSQVMDSKSKSSPKSMREVASQVTSHKNGDSSRIRVQVT